MIYSVDDIRSSVTEETFARLLEDLGSTRINRNTRRANCPVHQGDSVDSLAYSFRNGTVLWVCHSGCGGKGGDALKLIQEARGADFQDACNWLGEFLGLTPRPDKKRRKPAPQAQQNPMEPPPFDEPPLDAYDDVEVSAPVTRADKVAAAFADTMSKDRMEMIWSRTAGADPDSERYLASRGLSAGSAARFNTGKTGDPEADGYAARGYRIAVPLRNHESGKIVSFQFRLAGEPSEKSGRKVTTLKGLIGGAVFGLPGGTAAIPDDSALLVIEGLTDFLAVSAVGSFEVAGRGVTPIGFPGAGGARKLSEWGGVLKSRRVFVALDQDDAGEKSAALLARELTAAGAFPYRVRFNAKDLAKHLAGAEPGSLAKLLSDAEAWGIWDPGPQPGERVPTVEPRAVSALEFAQEKGDDLQWLIEPWLPSGSVGVIVASGGVGKAQPDDALVLTPRGFVRIDSLLVGDEVVSSDGTTTSVVGVFPQGEKDVFRVTMKDGGSTECCEDHLWQISERSGSTGRLLPERIAPLKDFMHRLKAYDGERFFSIPYLEPVYGPQIDLPLDPYALGAYLGDGTSNGSVVMHDEDEDVIARFSSCLPAGDTVARHSIRGVRVKKSVGTGGVGVPPSAFVVSLKAMGLHGLGSDKKFIPQEYMNSSIDQRSALLQGLCDTDGCATGSTVEYCTASAILARQVYELVWSLGGKAHLSRRKAGYKKHGVFHECKDSYRVTMTFTEGGVVPVSSSKHLAKWTPTAHGRRFVDSVTPSGKKRCRCIKVAATDGLYVTNDWIVTHNTTLLTQLGLAAARGEGSLWGFQIAKPVSVLYIAAEGARSMFRQRFLTAARSTGIALDGLPWYIQSADCRDYKIGSKGLDKLIDSAKAQLVILDTLGYFWSGDENSAVEWKAQVMGPLRRSVQSHGTSFLLVHHNSKGGGLDGEGWKKGRGTGAMHDDSDFYLRLEKIKAEDGGDSLRRDLWLDKNKYGPLGYATRLFFDTRSATFRQE